MKSKEVTERYAGPFVGAKTVLNGNKMPKPSDTAECRRMAEHYLACASQMTDPGDKAALLEMAKYWTRLAEQAGKSQD
jgi:hypothetical protein